MSSGRRSKASGRKSTSGGGRGGRKRASAEDEDDPFAFTGVDDVDGGTVGAAAGKKAGGRAAKKPRKGSVVVGAAGRGRAKGNNKRTKKEKEEEVEEEEENVEKEKEVVKEGRKTSPRTKPRAVKSAGRKRKTAKGKKKKQEDEEEQMKSESEEGEEETVDKKEEGEKVPRTKSKRARPKRQKEEVQKEQENETQVKSDGLTEDVTAEPRQHTTTEAQETHGVERKEERLLDEPTLQKQSEHQASERSIRSADDKAMPPGEEVSRAAADRTATRQEDIEETPKEEHTTDINASTEQPGSHESANASNKSFDERVEIEEPRDDPLQPAQGGKDESEDVKKELATSTEQEAKAETQESEKTAYLSSEQLHKKKVPDLRQLLKQLSLPTSGRKKQLIDRYLARVKELNLPPPAADTQSSANQEEVAGSEEISASVAPQIAARSDDDDQASGITELNTDDADIPASLHPLSQPTEMEQDEVSPIETPLLPQMEGVSTAAEAEATEEGAAEEVQPTEVSMVEREREEEELLVPNSLPSRESEAAMQMNVEVVPSITNFSETVSEAATDSTSISSTAYQPAANIEKEGKTDRKQRKMQEEMELVYRKRIETERKLKQLTERERRLKRRDEERKERIRAKREGRHISDKTREQDNDSSSDETSDLIFSDEDGDGDWRQAAKAKGKRKTPTPTRKTVKEGSAQRKTPGKTGKGTLAPRSLNSAGETEESLARASLGDADVQRPEPAADTNASTASKEDHPPPLLPTGKSTEQGPLDDEPSQQPRSRKRRLNDDEPTQEQNGGAKADSHLLEELKQKEEALSKELARLDEERDRVKMELDAVRAKRAQLLTEPAKSTTAEQHKEMEEQTTNSKTPTARRGREKPGRRRSGVTEKSENAKEAEEILLLDVNTTADGNSGGSKNENTKGTKRKRGGKESPRQTKGKKSRRNTLEVPQQEGSSAQGEPIADGIEKMIVAEATTVDESVDIVGEGDSNEAQKQPAALNATLVPVPPPNEKRPFRWRVGFSSLAGGRPENQDAYIVPLSALLSTTTSRGRGGRGRKSAGIEIDGGEVKSAAAPSDELAIFGVLDGHGLKGQYAAQAGAKHLQTFIEQSFSDLRKDDIAEGGQADVVELVKRAIKVGIEQTQDMLVKDGEESGIEYGTTAVICVQVENCLVIGNVGDSRAVLFRCPKAATPTAASFESLTKRGRGRGRGREKTGLSSGSRRGKLELVNPQLKEILISQDHRPWRKEEAERVARESKGRGHVTMGNDGRTLRVRPSLDYFTIEEIRDKKLGLAMTRSLGHTILSTCGVSSEPDFFSATLQDGDKLIIGCDGLWDMVTNKEAMHIVSLYAGQDPQAACSALVHEAERRWKERGGGDNITAVVVFFNTA